MLSNMDLGIKKNNLYELVADKLEAMILDDTIKIGERLPSEQSLAETFSVSRNIVREALKILKERGLIELKTGDGAHIIRPDPNRLRDMVSRMIVLGNVDLRHVYEIRQSLEGPSAGLAALRATSADLAGMEEALVGMEINIGNIDAWVQFDLQFHTAIAKASGNPLFYEFIKPLTGILGEIFARGYHAPGATQESVHKHRAIYDAIRAGDQALAQQRMLEHLSRSADDTGTAQMDAPQPVC